MFVCVWGAKHAGCAKCNRGHVCCTCRAPSAQSRCSSPQPGVPVYDGKCNRKCHLYVFCLEKNPEKRPVGAQEAPGLMSLAGRAKTVGCSLHLCANYQHSSMLSVAVIPFWNIPDPSICCHPPQALEPLPQRPFFPLHPAVFSKGDCNPSF